MNKNGNKSFWLSSYPKAGNTWLRMFIQNYKLDIHQNFDDLGKVGPISSALMYFINSEKNYNIQEIRKTYTFEDYENELPELYKEYYDKLERDVFCKTHQDFLVNTNGEDLFQTNATDGVVYLVRNPIDVVPSLANHLSISFDEAIDLMNDKDALFGRISRKSPDKEVTRLTKYAGQFPNKVSSWSNAVKNWTEQTKLPMIIVRYEDMVSEPEITFKKIVEFLGFEFNERRLKRALKHTSLKLFRAQEKTGIFKEIPVQSKGSSFFKYGTSGKGRELLTEEQIRRVINNNMEMMLKFKYI